MTTGGGGGAGGSTVVGLTRQLVQIDSSNPPGAEAEVAAFVKRRLEGAGLEVSTSELAPGRPSLLAHLGERGGPTLAFTAHMDTVPAEADQWRFPPLSGEVSDGRVYGRGTSDAKGSLAALIAAIERLVAMTDERRGAIELILTAGEETGSLGAAALASAGLLAPVDALVVAEPTSNYPFVAHKGVVRVVASSRAAATHASLGALRDNAVVSMAAVVQALEAWSEDAASHELLGSATLNIGYIAGGATFNTTPSEVTMGIDVRTVPPMSAQTVLGDLRRRAPGDIEFELVADLPHVVSAHDDRWIRRVFDLTRSITGVEAVAQGLPYSTDASVLAPAIGSPPTVIVGPGDADEAHKRDESCSIAALETAERIFVALVQDWWNGSIERFGDEKFISS